MTVTAAGLVGYVTCALLARLRLSAPPARLMRTNVNDKRVPAVLGGPLTVAAMTALACVALAAAAGWAAARIPERGVATALVLGVMGIAGAADDRRGDEATRGFTGHLAAARRGRLTGGVMKIVAAMIAGVGAGLLLFGPDLWAVVATVLLVAGAANAANLFDRAPGRAGKVVLLVAVPLLVAGDPDWAVAAAGALGALLACLPLDLSERGMLGDAGANPLGAVVGLGLAASLGPAGRWVAVAVLVALNLASERWSFSRAIERTPLLRKLDLIGRK
ncbi:MAG TPA: hypothetical protein VJ927_12560 [Actinomycetota bacterium]|nr:hypothetical protein [Actinomycetota bacterium]